MSRPLSDAVNGSSSEEQIVLPAEAILRLKADYEADVQLLEALPARIKQKKRKYEAALMFAPAGFDPNAAPPESPRPRVRLLELDDTPVNDPPETKAAFELVPPSEERSERPTWIGELARLLESSDRGIAHKDALATLKANPQLQSSQGDKGFYNAVARLEKQGRLVKSGGLLYSPSLVKKLEAEGKPLPDISAEMRRRAGGSASVVMEVLKENPAGLDAPRLRAAVGAKPGVPESIIKHGHYIYNVLATLMGQGAITKDAKGVYRAVDQEGNGA